MNIMILDHYAGSDKMGMEYRPYFLAKHWTEQGHKVVIVCASFSHLRRKNPMIGEDLKEEVQDGVCYVYMNTPTYTQSSSGTRGKNRNIFAFVRKLARYQNILAERYSPDVIIAASTYPFDCYPGKKIAKKSNAGLIYEIHDLLPLSLTELYHYPRHAALVWLLKKAQKKAVKNADAVVSVIAHADRYLSEIGIEVNNYYHIPNGINTESPKTSQYPQAHVDTIEKYRTKGKFVVVYLGGFMETNKVEILINAAKKLTAEVQVVLIGNGAERANLKKMAAQAHINNVHFLDTVPKACTQEVLHHADCLYLGTKNSILYDYGLGMNKIYDYMLSGKPILFASDSEDNPIALSGCGVLVKPEDPDDLIRGIHEICGMAPAEREEMGQKGYEYCMKNHDYKRIANQFLQVIAQLERQESQRNQSETGAEAN